MNEDLYPWLALAGASLGTYFCRAIGVTLSGQVNQESEFFRWLSAVTYAMVAALTVRMILLPIGLLSTVPLWLRVLACALSVGVMLTRSRQLTLGLLTGTLVVFGYGLMSAA